MYFQLLVRKDVSIPYKNGKTTVERVRNDFCQVVSLDNYILPSA